MPIVVGCQRRPPPYQCAILSSHDKQRHKGRLINLESWCCWPATSMYIPWFRSYFRSSGLALPIDLAICYGDRTFGLGGIMRGLIVGALAATMLSGCASMPDQDRTILAGATVGAGVGALIGSASGGPPGGWAGAAIGAAAGGVVGSLIKDNACYIRNRRGEIWRVPCTDQRVRAKACFVGTAPSTLTEVPCPH